LQAQIVIYFMNKLLQKIFISILLGLFILPAGLQAATSKKLHLVNQLKNHASPYLALHASDPVAWQDWSEKAVKLAKSQNKLLYLSIGYFSCHWCHVMQKESYKNPEIAAYLNKYFIPVKIDRELEPALDARLINFVERTRGMGGWPLNVFVTPDGYPLYAVLYEPAKNFKQVLVKLNDMWLNDRQQLKKLAREHVNNAKGPGAPKIDQAKVAAYTDKLVIGVRGYADSLNGGFGEQSKFPSVPQLSFLLHYIADSKNNKNRKNRARLKDILVLALDQMAMLGLRDHVGGGFFRYTVDPGWKTPHFEKMLYDNAQLASIYLQASQLLDRPDYLAVATDTLDFLQKEMKGKQGAYIAALSALDSRGIEGGYYLWSATKKDMSKLISAKIKLQKQRSKRVIPRDTKILAGWNGLALKAFSDAALITKNKKYQLAASKVRDHIVNHLWDGNSLKRSVVRGREVGRVALEDYAYVAQGLYAWASLTNKEADYQLLEKILKQAWIKFYGKRGWRLAEKSLIKTEGSQDVIADGVTPAPSALIAGLSLKVAARTKNEKLRNKALAALNSGHELVGRDPFWYASHVAALRDALSTNQQ